MILHIKRSLRTIRRSIAVWRWSFAVVWKAMYGRWHIFRDAPGWFVRMVAMGMAGDVEDDDVGSVVDAARAELRLRRQVQQRRLRQR